MKGYISRTFSLLSLRDAAIKVVDAFEPKGFSPVYRLRPHDLHTPLSRANMGRIVMLGFYSPALADKVLAQRAPVAPLLPWPVTLLELDGNHTEISAPDPTVVLSSTHATNAVAIELREALRSVIRGPYGGDSDAHRADETAAARRRRAAVTVSS